MDKAIIFDMDGVLVDSQPVHFQADRMHFDELGLHMSQRDIESLAGLSPAKRYQDFAVKYQLPFSPKEMFDRREELVAKLFLESKLTPTAGMLDLLKDVKSHHIKTAVASASPMPFIQLVLRTLGLMDYFDVIFTAEEVENGKPAPDVFFKAAEALGYAPESCIVIEDSHNGVLAANAAGMKVVGYQNPTSGQQDLQTATVVIHDFRKIDCDFLLHL